MLGLPIMSRSLSCIRSTQPETFVDKRIERDNVRESSFSNPAPSRLLKTMRAVVFKEWCDESKFVRIRVVTGDPLAIV